MKSVVKPKQSDEEKQLIESAFIEKKFSCAVTCWGKWIWCWIIRKTRLNPAHGWIHKCTSNGKPKSATSRNCTRFTGFGPVPRSWWGHKTHYSESNVDGPGSHSKAFPYRMEIPRLFSCSHFPLSEAKCHSQVFNFCNLRKIQHILFHPTSWFSLWLFSLSLEPSQQLTGVVQ